MQPTFDLDQKEAEDLVENLRVISDLAEAHPHTHVDDFIDFSRDKSDNRDLRTLVFPASSPSCNSQVFVP